MWRSIVKKYWDDVDWIHNKDLSGLIKSRKTLVYVSEYRNIFYSRYSLLEDCDKRRSKFGNF
jgi:hypothetical protein